jgi:hypothetical protein
MARIVSRSFVRAEAGHDHHRQVGRQLAQPAQRLGAVHAGHAHVQQDQADALVLALEHLQGG